MLLECHNSALSTGSKTVCSSFLKATFHLTISMHGQLPMGKIRRNNYHHVTCGPSFMGKMMSVFLIFTQGTRRNVKNRCLKGHFPLGRIFLAKQHFFCLKTNWWRVGIKRQKKISFHVENSAQWKTALKHLLLWAAGW